MVCLSLHILLYLSYTHTLQPLWSACPSMALDKARSMDGLKNYRFLLQILWGSKQQSYMLSWLCEHGWVKWYIVFSWFVLLETTLPSENVLFSHLCPLILANFHLYFKPIGVISSHFFLAGPRWNRVSSFCMLMALLGSGVALIIWYHVCSPAYLFEEVGF